MIIFKDKFGWQEQVKHTDQNGNVISKYVSYKFAKCDEPQGFPTKTGKLGANITPTRWFHSCFKKKDGTVDICVVVLAYEEKKQSRSKTGKIAAITNASEPDTREMEEDDTFLDPEELPFF